MNSARSFAAGVIVVSVFALATLAHAQSQPTIEGLWRSYKNTGPEIAGPLLIGQSGNSLWADLGGMRVPVERSKNDIRFTVPGDRGEFNGRIEGDSLRGHWIQPPPMQVGLRMASPVHFKHLGQKRWMGEIVPRESEFTFFLPITQRDDGKLGVYLRNPDRNLGIYTNLDFVRVMDQDLQYVGSFFRSSDQGVMARGTWFEDYDVLTLELPPWRGGTYDFVRVTDEANSHFFARGKDPKPYRYRQPVKLDDGWPVGTLENADIDFGPIRDMIEQQIDTPATDVHSHYVHGVLIARHGKLVFEEYFHGFHRDLPHDTRSASKSMASMLVGAAMQAGEKIDPSLPVYETLRGAEFSRGLESRKQAMTLQHLLTMSSGFYCDDNDSNAPGNEDTLQEQEDQPDWYQFTLDLPMADEPGSNPIYCSANSNLIGAMLNAATNRSVTDLFAELIAEPLGIKRYYLGLQPTGEPYLGGGAHWLPRDFMKLGQVMLDGGTWNGRRIVSKRWAEQSTSTQVTLRDRDYGYQWWITEYPYADGSVTAFFAAGNGGQIVMGIPELDLLIVFYGGNYSDATLYKAQRELIPNYILRAVKP